ncbi:MAG: chemotaxis protein CheW [Peptococcaceae bacterium]|nr:chemotaxis protein CheW [Peptococcaceae bacterium]
MSGKLVVFMLNQEEYALPIEHVKEITKLDKITAVPDAPSFVKGIVNLRGTVVPILDLHKRLQLKRSVCDIALIAEIDGLPVGMGVNEVKEVSDLGEYQAPPQIIANPCIEGILNLSDRLVMVLQVNNLISDEEKFLLNQMTK